MAADETQFDNTDFSQTLSDTSRDDAEPEESTEQPEVEEVEREEEVETKPPEEEEGEEKREEVKGEEKEKAPSKPKPEDQKFKVKVYGQEREVPVRDLIRGYQKSEAADRRFQEAAQQRAQIDRYMQQLRADPWKAFELAGMDPYEAAERVVWNKYVEARMTPAQRAEWQAKQRIAETEARLAQHEERARFQQAQGEAMRYTQYYTPILEEAIIKHGVPDTDYGRQKLIDALFADLNDGVEPNALDLAERVNGDFAQELTALKRLPPDKLAQLLGDDTAKKIAQARVRQGKIRPSGPKTSFQPRPGEQEKTHYVSEEDFEKSMERFRARGD